MTGSAATLLALAAGLVGAGAGTSDGSHAPVFLTATEQPGRVLVAVRGKADEAFAARYTLDTVSGGNRTHQTGNARLERGQAATFITLDLSAHGAWSAVLRVELEPGTTYEQRYGTPAGRN